MTDNEIIKALECCLDISPSTCKNCPLFNVTNSTMVCSKIATKFALDLINRQKAEYNNLLEQFRILDCECERLEKADENQKAEIERLKTNLNIELNNFASEYDDKIKAEAVKEFAEKIYTEINEALAQNHKVKVERINKLIARGIKSNDEFCYEIDGKILALRGISEFIDNLVKEMVGEDK